VFQSVGEKYGFFQRVSVRSDLGYFVCGLIVVYVFELFYLDFVVDVGFGEGKVFYVVRYFLE